MKNFISIIKRRISQVLIVVMMLSLWNCSTEDQSIDDPSQINLKDANTLKVVNTWQDQIENLTKKTRQYHNFQVAEAQGFEFLIKIPNMGDHFVKYARWDDTFNYLEPEILIYIINDEGEREFVGVEYLVNSENAPEGFIGDDDVWFPLAPGLWALHAWVGLENPDGVFHPTNSNVTY